jgi:predicted oxidoreductase
MLQVLKTFQYIWNGFLYGMEFAKDSATHVLKETFKEIPKENTNVTRMTIVSYLDRHPNMD